MRLARSASALARGGARFWVARPVLGVEGVRGLETALGAHYVAVLPGPPDAPRQAEFVALEEPPLSEDEDPGALEIVLQSGERAGLVRGAPVFYRGIPIGTLVSVGLAGDATAEGLAGGLAEGVLGRLVRAQVSKGKRVEGVQTYKLRVDNASPLLLNGLAVTGPEPGPEAAPSVLAGFSLPPRRSITFTITGDAVDRLGLESGVKVVAADLSGL